MIKIKPLEPDMLEDLRYIANNLRPRDAEELLATQWLDDLSDLAEATLSYPSFSYVFYLNDEPVLVVGGNPEHPGVYRMFLYGTEKLRKIGKSVTSFVKHVMLPTLVRQGIHRAHCYSLDTYTETHRWLESFGSIKEATLKGYGKNQEDFAVFAWFPNVHEQETQKGS